ncbi:MAG: hypothetical protein JETCAE03_17940 [Ignavibacteriaceae bacterium]|nr:MAG: hypothetical protein BroJett017_14780 [Ignavibacteriota bacterium]GJQ42296.1 MAG: hypothetical protein JETCAE03_17940 [Ignavibacteriaceae bacterium]
MKIVVYHNLVFQSLRFETAFLKEIIYLILKCLKQLIISYGNNRLFRKVERQMGSVRAGIQ